MTGLPSLEQLNHWCVAHDLHLRFLGIAQHSPRLINAGFLALDRECLALAEAIRTTLKVDEWHALVDTGREGLTEEMHYQVVRYSEMLALRQLGKMPAVLAANVLSYCQASGSLLLQKRGASSHLFPGFLSLLGGGFNPSLTELIPADKSRGNEGLIGDSNNLKLTAQREFLEESGLSLVIPETTLVTITQETDNGALQINYLGVPADFTGAYADEEEGLLVELPVLQLKQVAALEPFTDLAKANIAAWLISRSMIKAF
ncbi:hypothetical protein QWY82_01075 [Simiduia curdlanivorans]|uniref:Nudix hydrolase domain-containing protein n=1 Tax=Simiduia curdlanivorans TaxID=1492769 RepID=A0ABV8V5G4_9GAMM|nr:hypothetical protein [Simiduia curdlanivorans]MDN3637387.1 hypothetical protein [Simiduia curdlanivorans]